MPAPTALTPLQRRDLKARAHALDSVVLVGDAGLTPGVLAEIDRSLAAHELIKVRVTGDDRDARLAMRDRIVDELGAEPVQAIGKLLVLFRKAPPPEAAFPSGRPAPRKTARAPRAAVKRFGPKPSTRRTPDNASPPRTARVRKSGQRSAKKPHQGR